MRKDAQARRNLSGIVSSEDVLRDMFKKKCITTYGRQLKEFWQKLYSF
jgi:hypothetical protein